MTLGYTRSHHSGAADKRRWQLAGKESVANPVVEGT